MIWILILPERVDCSDIQPTDYASNIEWRQARIQRMQDFYLPKTNAIKAEILTLVPTAKVRAGQSLILEDCEEQEVLKLQAALGDRVRWIKNQPIELKKVI